jgi:hypothetical protein
MAKVRISWARTQKDIGIGILIVALGHWLDGVDGVVNWSVVALSPSKVIVPTPITIVIAAIVVVTTPIIAPVIWAVILLVRAGSPANVLIC